ncbi:hypothetical protein ACFL6R_00275 [Gemmatimonadota bacterium]
MKRVLLISILSSVICMGFQPGHLQAQTEHEAEYRPLRFSTPEGEGIYFGHAVEIVPYSGRYLLVCDDQGDDVYFLDVETLAGQRVGAEGDGPGEYRIATGFWTVGDTLVIQNGPRYLKYSLPDLEYLEMTMMEVFRRGRNPVWEDDGSFFTPELPMEHFFQGLFAHFSATGELLEIYGEFDQLEKYGSPRMLKFSMNGGYLRKIPDGRLAFFYGYQPRVLFFTTSGEETGSLDLKMPWNGRGQVNPFNSEQMGWAARSLVESVTLVDNGFLISANGWKRRGREPSAVLARYSWTGDLLEIINLPLPEPELREPLEDRVSAATVLNGRYFVLVYGDPAVREVIIRQ